MFAAAGGGSSWPPRRSTWRPILREWLFDKTPTVVLTSATLSIGHSASFDFFKSRIGLTQSDSPGSGSPFDYQRQVELILLDGMPDPADREPTTIARRSK